MCELFGMSACQPITTRRELEEFRLRGGLSADNPDGWGLAWLEHGNFQLAKEPRPAFRSILFEDLGATLRSSLVIAHVRKAWHPPINTMGNTHPFRSTCCSKEWVFAHNGLVPFKTTALLLIFFPLDLTPRIAFLQDFQRRLPRRIAAAIAARPQPPQKRDDA